MAGAPVCVNCRERPVDPAFRPFCSQRCKLADLNRWLTGEYRVPGEPLAPADDPDRPHDDEDEGSDPFL